MLQQKLKAFIFSSRKSNLIIFNNSDRNDMLSIFTNLKIFFNLIRNKLSAKKCKNTNSKIFKIKNEIKYYKAI